LPLDPLGEIGEGDALPRGEAGEITAEERAGLGVAAAPELVVWHAVTKADPRIAHMASGMREFRLMPLLDSPAG
jgi:hypothetical protein